jgi:hypothetical protein
MALGADMAANQIPAGLFGADFDPDAIKAAQKQQTLNNDLTVARLTDAQYRNFSAGQTGGLIGNAITEIASPGSLDPEGAAAREATREVSQGADILDVLKKQADKLQAAGQVGSAARLRERIASEEEKRANTNLRKLEGEAKVAAAQAKVKAQLQGIDMGAYEELYKKGHIKPNSWPLFVKSVSEGKADPSLLEYSQGEIKTHRTADGKEVTYFLKPDGTVTNLTPSSTNVNVGVNNLPKAETTSQQDQVKAIGTVYELADKVKAQYKDLLDSNNQIEQANNLYKQATTGDRSPAAAAGLREMLYKMLSQDRSRTAFQTRQITEAKSILDRAVDSISKGLTGADSDATLKDYITVLNKLKAANREEAAQALSQTQKVMRTSQNASGITIAPENENLVTAPLMRVLGIGEQAGEVAGPTTTTLPSSAVGASGAGAHRDAQGRVAGFRAPRIGTAQESGRGTQPLVKTPLSGTAPRGAPVQSNETDAQGRKIWKIQ